MTMPDHPRRRARYSALTRRILFVNALVLLVLIAGCMIAYAAIWRINAAETLASMFAVIAGAAPL